MSPRLRLFLPLIVTLGLGALLWLGLGKDPYRQDEATLGRTLPTWQSDNLLDGGIIDTAALKGEPFVLNVWASWCPNCRAEHPLLGDLTNVVPLYGLNYRDKGDAARAWLIQAGNPYRAVLADPDGKLALELGVYGTPETYLFAGDGTLLTRHTGELTREVWQRQFAPLLAKARSNTASQPARSGKKSGERSKETSAGEQAMSRLGHALIAPLLLALSLGALASGVDTYEFRHPERQTRAQELARALRCPQCQNQNLVESNSPIARDLRLEVYRWVDEGQSDEQVITRMTARFGDFVRYDPPFKASTALLWGGPALLLLLALSRLRRSLHRRQPARVPLVGDRAEGMLAHDPRAELNRLIMAEQQAGLAPHSRLYRELELARLANATPSAEQALRDRLIRDSTAHPQLRFRPWILVGALLLALMAGIYAGTGRYQAWQDYQSRPDPLAGLSPRDLQDKELGALHQRLQANPADLDGWAALGQLYLYRDEYTNALLAYQRLALLEGGASAATQAAQATVLYYQAGQQLTPEALRLLESALKQDKGEVSALMLLASDHFLHGRYSRAIALWQQLLDEERPRINRAALIEAIQTARIMGG